MTLKKLTLAAAICLSTLGWTAAQSQDQNYPRAGQQDNRSAQDRSGDTRQQRASRDGTRNSHGQQGRGQGTSDYQGRNRGDRQTQGAYDRGSRYSVQGQRSDRRYGQGRNQWSSSQYGRGRSGYGRHCSMQWRHHHRVRVCR
jgi:hypothetical protein